MTRGTTVSEREVLFSHPHDHFNLLHLSAIPNTCFVLMPFDEQFRLVYETIAKALKGLMVCSRADDLPLGKPILERVLTGIRSAELIVADLTGKNANVFYELGLAHTHTKNVLLLTQNINDVPFDLRGLFCHDYSPHSAAGLKRLAQVVRAAAQDVRARAVPTMLKGALTRTQQVVEYMERQLTPPLTPKGLVVRVQAGFSSVANMGYPAAEDQDTRDYGALLERERDRLVQMLSAGAVLRAIIFPPVGPWTAQQGARWRSRYDKLVEFLKSDVWDRCEFVLSTEEGANLLFFGEEVLFEGHKTGIEPGYGWTMVYTDKEYLTTRLTIFDMLFQSAKRHTLKRYGPGGSTGSDQEALRAAVLNAVELARDGKVKRWLPTDLQSSAAVTK
jgi:hypothetical protein